MIASPEDLGQQCESNCLLCLTIHLVISVFCEGHHWQLDMHANIKMSVMFLTAYTHHKMIQARLSEEPHIVDS